MNCKIVAVGGFDGERSVNGVFEIINKIALVVVFVAVRLVGGNFPGEGIGFDIEFS